MPSRAATVQPGGGERVFEFAFAGETAGREELEVDGGDPMPLVQVWGE